MWPPDGSLTRGTWRTWCWLQSLNSASLRINQWRWACEHMNCLKSNVSPDVLKFDANNLTSSYKWHVSILSDGSDAMMACLTNEPGADERHCDLCPDLCWLDGWLILTIDDEDWISWHHDHILWWLRMIERWWRCIMSWLDRWRHRHDHWCDCWGDWSQWGKWCWGYELWLWCWVQDGFSHKGLSTWLLNRWLIWRMKRIEQENDKTTEHWIEQDIWHDSWCFEIKMW